ncbi:hypothetical protein BB560_000903 [Smittium megazygosporum]|uniref:Uncharacterized protein n=1 Tax=Smittium megazygosporum TaxID=133381 RepID=A0A2T9ZJ09_9FUNG|nr:hypothetical protein BB560_000903 [Smittium megazygosporum]
MRITDPSAAKPNCFAIGSASKRDRSGSGDKAASAEATKSSTPAHIEQINTEVALSNTAELMQQQTNIGEMEV